MLAKAAWLGGEGPVSPLPLFYSSSDQKESPQTAVGPSPRTSDRSAAPHGCLIVGVFRSAGEGQATVRGDGDQRVRAKDPNMDGGEHERRETTRVALLGVVGVSVEHVHNLFSHLSARKRNDLLFNFLPPYNN